MSIGGEHTYEDVITVGRYLAHHHVVRAFGTEAAFVHDDKGQRLHTSRRETASKGALFPRFVQSINVGSDSAPAYGREFKLIRTCATADRSLNSQKAEEILYR